MMYPNLRDAFIGELQRLVEEGHTAEPIHDANSPASEFGSNPQHSIELLGTSFGVHDVCSNLISFPLRPFNLRYGVGQLLWTLAGSDDPDWIEYYRGKRSRQKKAAFGNRLLKNRGSIDQCEIALQRMLNDPGTRRTYMPIFSVDDHVHPKGEVPCAAGLQIFLRDDRLHGVTVMRAQNGTNSLPMDVFIFTSLLHFLASKVGKAVGSYSHMCSTFHIFRHDVPMGTEVIRASREVQCLSLGDTQGCSEDLAELLHFEEQIRMSGDERTVLEAPQTRCRSEWARNVQKILLAIGLEKTGRGDLIPSLDIPVGLAELLHGTRPSPQVQSSGLRM